MPGRDERCAENQYRFNRANNRLRDLVGERVRADRRIPFLCECADEACLATVTLDLTEYGYLHENRRMFVIVPGHSRVEGEVVLQREARFEQVEKGECDG
jgi:hypothetical protein